MLNKIRHNKEQVICTVLTVVLLCSVIISMIGYVYKFAEEEGLEQLHLETLQIKNSLNLQIISDRENLQTMANFASKLYSDGEGFDLLLRSFKEIGLIKNIGILMPDNSFVTKLGTVDASKVFSFADEVKKGSYVSGRVSDVTHDKHEVVRSAVPIEVNGETVAMLYGVIELDVLENEYREAVELLGAELFVLEGVNGNMLIDTKREKLGNITSMASLLYKRDYSYPKVISDLSLGADGFTSYKSRSSSDYVYAHYAPLEIGDWRIMLTLPEDVLYEDARETEKVLLMMFFMVIVVMVAYLFFITSLAERKSKVSVFASIIRKRLLELNKSADNIWKALDSITEFAHSRSAFFLDSTGEDYSSIIPSQKQNLLQGEDLNYFAHKLMGYVSKQKKELGVSVQVNKLIVSKKMMKSNQEFCNFLQKHNIQTVYFAGVTDDINNTILIGVVNPKNILVEALLKEIAVCFSMAVYNKKHLIKTETMALTDSLTSLANRMAYKQDVLDINDRRPKNLACIYIDVNELHYFNNTYGHAAGDQMLVYIAEVLKSEFSSNGIYRMGGDEFLIFTENIDAQTLEEKMKKANALIEEMKYRISYGIEYWNGECEIEEFVTIAEQEMLVEKAKYYQDKEAKHLAETVPKNKITTVTTGIKAVDACLSVMSIKYGGIFSVCLNTDRAAQIMAPENYFGLANDKNDFSDILKQYINKAVKPEFHRILSSFTDYSVVETQLREGRVPKISYTKLDNEKVTLSIYMISDENNKTDTLWVFEKGIS